MWSATEYCSLLGYKLQTQTQAVLLCLAEDNQNKLAQP